MSPDGGADLCRQHPRCFRQARPGQCRDLQGQCRGLQGQKIKATDRADPQGRDRSTKIPEDKRWLVSSEGAFSYLARDFGLKEALSLADQRRPAGHAAAGPQGDRRRRANNIPVVFSESTISRSRPAGGARDRRKIWRRALCRFAERGGRPGSDLYRPAEASRPRPSPRAFRPMNLQVKAGPAKPPAAQRRARHRVSARPSPTATAIPPCSMPPSHPDRHHHGAGRRQRQRQVDPVQGDHGLCAASRAAKSRILRHAGAGSAEEEPRRLCAAGEEVDWNFPVLVEDVVMMGRYGHMNMLRIAGRPITTLSKPRLPASA
jgi:hypothetical protein